MQTLIQEKQFSSQGAVQVLAQIWRALLPAEALLFGLQADALRCWKMLQ
jgi:hypothetical protein